MLVVRKAAAGKRRKDEVGLGVSKGCPIWSGEVVVTGVEQCVSRGGIALHDIIRTGGAPGFGRDEVVFVMAEQLRHGLLTDGEDGRMTNVEIKEGQLGPDNVVSLEVGIVKAHGVWHPAENNRMTVAVGMGTLVVRDLSLSQFCEAGDRSGRTWRGSGSLGSCSVSVGVRVGRGGARGRVGGGRGGVSPARTRRGDKRCRLESGRACEGGREEVGVARRSVGSMGTMVAAG